MSTHGQQDVLDIRTPSADEKVHAISDSSQASLPQDQPMHQETNSGARAWSPFILTWWIPAVIFPLMILAGMGLEIAFHFTNKNRGWSLPANPTTHDYIHYIYTWIPVIIVMGIVTYVTAADQEIMKLQPYLDLAKATGTPGDSLLMDYASKPKFLVWILQVQSRHFLAALSSLLVLMLLTLQPLASSLLLIKDTEFTRPPLGVPKFGTVGINDTFSTLQGFASAAGFAEADARYDIGRPPFVWKTWAVDEFQRPTAFISNGTIEVNTTGIQTQPNCVIADQTSYAAVTGGTQLTSSWQGCSLSMNFDDTAKTQFGVDVTRNCTASNITSLGDPFKPVVFWFADAEPNPPVASVVFCSPKLTLHTVTVTVNLANGQLINVQPIGAYDLPTNVTSGPPLNGQVFNGVQFNTTGVDADTLLRANLTQLQLPTSVFTLLEAEGLDTILQNSTQVVNITATRYQLFLALSARSNYFVTDNSGDHVFVSITEIQQRLWMSTLSTHLMAVVLIVGGLTGFSLHYFHQRRRSGVKLFAPPGSIASAATVTKGSPLNGFISGGMDESRLRQALHDHKFAVDPLGRIILADSQSH